MAIERPFPDHESIDARYAELRRARDTNVSRFEDHWDALGDKTIRAALLKSGMKKVVEDIGPLQWLKRTLGGGGVASQLLMGSITHKGSITRRLLTSALTLAAPGLLARVPWSKLLDRIRGNGHAQAPDLHGN